MRRDARTEKWKPFGVVFILILSAFFCGFTLQAIDVAKGTTVSGHISIDTVWNLAGSPYVVMNDVVVDPGVTLTIEPGVQVRFDPIDPGPPPGHDYLSIFVEGSLVSNGRSDLPIGFTSDSPTPKTYDWWAILANSSGHVEISYSNISYSSFGVAVLSSNIQRTSKAWSFPHHLHTTTWQTTQLLTTLEHSWGWENHLATSLSTTQLWVNQRLYSVTTPQTM